MANRQSGGLVKLLGTRQAQGKSADPILLSLASADFELMLQSWPVGDSESVTPRSW